MLNFLADRITDGSTLSKITFLFESDGSNFYSNNRKEIQIWDRSEPEVKFNNENTMKHAVYLDNELRI